MDVNHAVVRPGAAIPSLVRWGLSADADLVYRCLVTFGPQDARKLASDLGMAVRRVQAAVEELAAVRAVSARPGRTGRISARPRWAAAPPAGVLSGLRRRKPRVVDLADHAGRHRALLDAVALSGHAYPHGLRANQLTDRATTRERIAELAAAERHEHLALCTERSFAPDAVAVALPLDRQLLARGVQLRTCGIPPDDGDASSAAAEELASLGFDYRERAEVPLKLIVFDRRIALVPVDPLDLDAGTLEIDHPAVVGALVTLFERLWSTARDPREGGVPPVVLTPREQAIVGLLANGHTDSSAAQYLGISQRTIAYALRALMDRIGVQNRFQLGLALGATNAVTLPAINEEENH